MATQIKVTEAAGWLAQKLHDYALGAIPDQAKLEILTQRMRADAQNKRAAYMAALSSQCELQDPDHPSVGRIPTEQAKLKHRNEQGASYAQELQGGNLTADRKAQLEAYLKQCSADCTALEAQIKVDQSLLATRKETTSLRKKEYDAAKAELNQLETVAPTILAQTQALKDAAKEKLRAAADAAHHTESGVGSLIGDYQKELQAAQAANAAATHIESEEVGSTIDLDKVDAAESTIHADDERIARWMNKAPATASTGA